MPIPKPGTDSADRRVLVRDRVRDEIRQAIFDGTLVPGERLDEASLRSWLDVSATPIRQALHALELEGLIESAPQSHTIVASPRAELALANLQTVGVLLSGISVLTVPLLAETERRKLADDAASVAELLAAGETDRAARASGSYFRELVERCPNPVLVSLAHRYGRSLGFHVIHARGGVTGIVDRLAESYVALEAAMRDGEASMIDAATRRVFLIDVDSAGTAS